MMASIAGLRRRLRLLLGRVPDRLPDFFVLGATRSGSSFLHAALGEHPDVFVPAKKELMYFNRDGRYEPSLKAYRRHFVGYAGQKRVGESTPLYLSKGVTYTPSGHMRFDAAEDAVVRIARHMPDAQHIISLRDPMTRMVSEYEKNVSQGKYTASINDILSSELDGQRPPNSLLYHNQYDVHLRHVYDHMPDENVKILVFEEWTMEPEVTLSALQSFLGVERRAVQVERLGRNTRSRYSGKSSAVTPASEISPAIRQRVLEYLQPSRDYLERKLGRKLPWHSM